MHDYELANLHYSYLTGLYSASNDDEVIEELEIDEILSNSGSTLYNQVKLPKVVE